MASGGIKRWLMHTVLTSNHKGVLMRKSYPNIIGRGGSYVVTDDLSGGLVYPREPRGNIRVAAYGKGVRTNKYGFQRDQTGGNRIPKCGLERRAMALGARVAQPELVTLSAVSAGRRGNAARAAIQACRAGRKSAREARAAELAERPGIVAKARRTLISNTAAEFNTALREAAKEINLHVSKKLRKSLDSLVAIHNGGGENLKGGL